MAPWIKALSIEPGDLSSGPGVHWGKSGTDSWKWSCDIHAVVTAYVCMHTHQLTIEYAFYIRTKHRLHFKHVYKWNLVHRQPFCFVICNTSIKVLLKLSLPSSCSFLQVAISNLRVAQVSYAWNTRYNSFRNPWSGWQYSLYLIVCPPIKAHLRTPVRSNEIPPDKYLWLKLLCLRWNAEPDASAISWNEGSIPVLLGGERSFIISWTKSKAPPPCWECNRDCN